MGFFRQEYRSGLPFPSPGDRPNPGIESASPALQADLYHLNHQGSPRSVVMKKTLESPLDSRDIKPVNPKETNPEYSLEVPILWPPDGKNRLIGKDPNAGKIEGRRRRGKQRTRWLDGITDSMDIEFEQTLRESEK